MQTWTQLVVPHVMHASSFLLHQLGLSNKASHTFSSCLFCCTSIFFRGLSIQALKNSKTINQGPESFVLLIQDLNKRKFSFRDLKDRNYQSRTQTFETMFDILWILAILQYFYKSQFQKVKDILISCSKKRKDILISHEWNK